MKGITKRDLTTAKEWAIGSITLAEAGRRYKRQGVSVYVRLARCMKVLYNQPRDGT